MLENDRRRRGISCKGQITLESFGVTYIVRLCTG